VSPPGDGHDTTVSSTTARPDSTTGLHLQATTDLVSLRVARSSRGPLTLYYDGQS